MSLLPVFEWLGQSLLGIFMQKSSYCFELAEMFHLLALAGLGGGILIMNLRILGLRLNSEPPAHLLRELMPYLTGCLLTMIGSGFLLLAAEPMKCYYNTAFRVKMPLLMAAILFSVFVQRPLIQSKIAAVISMLIWLGVAVAGRAIGVL